MAPGALRSDGLGRIFLQGVLVNLLNPKTALFFLAFLPQFADPARGALAPQILLLGGILLGLGMVSDGIYAVLAGSLGSWLRQRGGAVRAQRVLSGTVYIVLGLAAALAGAARG